MQSSGNIRLTEIASQLSVSEGKVRGWKAKDKWESLITGEVEIVVEEGLPYEIIPINNGLALLL
ncbi:phage terminase small subunit-related protein (plasmid) [Paenibacillus polymyxa]|uniref:phage terminase small subunit-related protein n=1 Tax=Paenibacillus polymyxa TaxID=1406 RepID=UPI003B5B6C4E